MPEHQLMAEIYIWFHPVLRTMSAGVLIWRGMQPSSLACDYVHHHHFLPMPADISHYRIEPLGLEIEVLEPLKRARMCMKDPERDVSFDVTLTGVLPPLGRPNGHHLVPARARQRHALWRADRDRWLLMRDRRGTPSATKPRATCRP